MNKSMSISRGKGMAAMCTNAMSGFLQTASATATKYALTTLLLLIAVLCHAQMEDPVKFTAQLKTGTTADAEIVFTAKIEPGWHVYSTELGGGGPIEATFEAKRHDGIELVGKLMPRGKELSKFDNMFGMKVRYFEHTATFVQKIRFTKPQYVLNCMLTYGACSDKTCMPPSDVSLNKQGKAPAHVADGAAAAKATDAKVAGTKAADAGAKTAGATEKGAMTGAEARNAAINEGGADGGVAARPEPGMAIDDAFGATATTDDTTTAAPDASASLTEADRAKLWQPVIKELQGFEEKTNNSLIYIFFAGLLGGFLALFTPCVWPIIPMTVSFFLKRNKDRRKAVREAMAYGASIVAIYVTLGLAVTLLFGASTLNALSTNAVFNLLFFAMLVVFAASFFGAFEIQLPSSWSNKMNTASSSTSGMLSIFFMAFTLTLVSFSCTGPIIGFLLVAVSTQGEIVAPAVGMFGFALALAIPFTLFALFPSLLKSAPKSGGWMNVLKVTLGFIELAFALKFLSVADLAYGWHILDRETFLALWIVLFTLLGFYLLGMFHFPHDDEGRRTNVPQFFLALCSLAFAVYMVPGLWGAPLKAISAFSPPVTTQDFNLYKNTVHARFTSYEAGMAAARLEGKPALIDFTGFGCVNCRKMEAAVWTDATVADLLNNKYVLISLYVDDKTPLAEPMTVEENGQQRTLRTVGDKWSYLQRHKFGANTQPFYVAVDADGKPLSPSRSYDEDVSEYVDFLNSALTKATTK